MRIDSERLALRAFTKGDLDDLAALNSDPDVMRFFPATMSPAESAEAMKRWNERLAKNGIGMLCARERRDGSFVGIIGAQWVPYPADFTPAIEIGWRLAVSKWGRGLATEGARCVIDYVFATQDVDEVVAVAVLQNVASTAVMHRLGMQEVGRFEHPLVDPGSRLRLHSIHWLSREHWYFRAANGRT